MKKACLAFFILFIGQIINAQDNSQEKLFYYYKNERVYLDKDYSRISVVWNSVIDSNEFRRWQMLPIIGVKKMDVDSRKQTFVPIDKMKSIQDTSFIITEIEFPENTVWQDYEKYVQQILAENNVVKVIPAYMISGQPLSISSKFYVKLFKEEEDRYKLAEFAKKHAIQVIGYNEFMPLWMTLACTKECTLNAIEAADLFYETGMFESAEPEILYYDLLLSDDKYFGNQWGLKNTGQHCKTADIDIRAESAWTLTTGSPNIKVAVFDQGIKMDHPDLENNIYGMGYDAETDTTPSCLRGSHGTACAGIIAAQQNNSIGVSGVAPNVKLISVSCALTFGNTAQQLANGFNWAWRNGADVISNSWGGYAPSAVIDDAIKNALIRGRNGKGTVVVFSAGNDNNTSIRYPAKSNTDILVVGAISPNGERKSDKSCDKENWGSCYGSMLDVMAPGVRVPTTTSDGKYRDDFNGTSSACPHVAGVAALVLSVNPNLTALQVRNVIESTEKVGGYDYRGVSGMPNGTWHEEMGYGLVDAYAAVRAASAPSIDLFDRVITENTTVLNYYGDINVKNVKVQNGAKLVLDAVGNVNIMGDFEVELGSEYEILR